MNFISVYLALHIQLNGICYFASSTIHVYVNIQTTSLKYLDMTVQAFLECLVTNSLYLVKGHWYFATIF